MSANNSEEHLYYGVLFHEDRLKNVPEGTLRKMLEIEIERDGLDMTATVFVIASSQAEAQKRISEHFGWEVPVTLVSSGFATIMSGAEVAAAIGVRGTLNWQELDKCPECHSNHLRHDASVGESDCVSCGWGEEWATS